MDIQPCIPAEGMKSECKSWSKANGYRCVEARGCHDQLLTLAVFQELQDRSDPGRVVVWRVQCFVNRIAQLRREREREREGGSFTRTPLVQGFTALHGFAAKGMKSEIMKLVDNEWVQVRIGQRLSCQGGSSN